MAPGKMRLQRLHRFADGGRLRRTASSGDGVEDAWQILIALAQNPGDLLAWQSLPPAGLLPPGPKAAQSRAPSASAYA
jgi:hypothetical protein